MAAKEGKKPKFPLPRGYFGEMVLSKEQQEYYREFCENQVQRGLLDERAFVQSQKQVDTKKWKTVRSQHGFQLYRRRDAGLFENDGKPSMIGVGRIEGSIEDVLYGAYDHTDEELRMTAELVEVDFGDGIVLSNMDQGSPSDPYRYLGIKWILTPFPMPALMPDRDWILLESMGISKDASGRRYGYHTLFTVELPQCPAFPEVIRGTMWYTFIYRDAGRGMIDVHAQGYFDCLGDLIDPITVIGSAQMFNAVFRYMKSAEAKKLTILALENLEKKIAAGLPPTTEKPTASGSQCSICSKHRSVNPLSSRRMRVCRVCDAVMCKNCRVKKNILVGRQRVQAKVSVCQKCIAHAKTLIVDPADEKYVISRDMQIGDRAHSNSTALSVFDTLSSGRHDLSSFLTGQEQSTSQTSSVEETGTANLASGYGELEYQQLQQELIEQVRALEVSGDRVRGTSDGLVLHEESYHEAQTQRLSMQGSRNDADAEDMNAVVAEQQALFAKMLELQQAAKRAHELTLASRHMMLETNVTHNV